MVCYIRKHNHNYPINHKKGNKIKRKTNMINKIKRGNYD